MDCAFHILIIFSKVVVGYFFHARNVSARPFKHFVRMRLNVQKRRINSLLAHYLFGVEHMANINVQLRNAGRDRIAIVAEILEMARQGILKTNIMYNVGLNSDMLGRYVGLMVNAKLLERVLIDKKVVYKTTHKGTEFMYHCCEIERLLEAENDTNKPNGRTDLLPSIMQCTTPLGAHSDSRKEVYPIIPDRG
jgi:predicted transcriptional regulator